jgi:hypothetical protein
MGLGSFLKKVVKVVAIVAAVVSVVGLVAPAFAEMVTGAISSIGSSIASTVSNIFAGGEAAASAAAGAASTEAAAGVAASNAAAGSAGTAAAAGTEAAAADIAAMADVGMNTATTHGVTQAASQASIPAAESSAQAAANVAAQSGFPGPDAFGDGLVSPSTQLVAPQTQMVAPDTQLVSNPVNRVEWYGGGDMSYPPSDFVPKKPEGGLLSKAWEGAKAVGDWAQKNQLLASVGLKTVAGMLQESPYQAQVRAQMEYDDWARRRLNESINGTPSPFNASGPQQRLQYVGGGYVFPNTPQGIISRNLAG